MFRNMKVGARMALGFGVVLLFMATIIGVSLHQTQVTRYDMERIVKVNEVRIQLANTMINRARETAIAVRNTLLAKYRNEPDGALQKIQDDLAGHRREYADSVAKVENLIPQDDPEVMGLLDNVKAIGDTASKLQDHVIALALSGKPAEGADFMLKEAYPTVKLWIGKADEFIRKNEDRTEIRRNEAEESARLAQNAMFILGGTALALSVVIVAFLTLSITQPLKTSVQAADRIASGNLDVDLSAAVQRRDELGSLVQSFGKMVSTLREVANQADVISTGDYSVRIAPRSDKDVMGVALQRMAGSLKSNQDQVQRQDWLKTSIARLNVAMSGDPDLSVLASRAISELSTSLDAKVGALYVARDGIPATLSLLGTYACTKGENLPDAFKPGEGLVGQAAMERKPILVRNVPDGYIKVASGLGDHIPRFLVVSPFVVEDRIKGVVELGTLGEITDLQTEYLRQAMPIVALAVEVAQARDTQARLLEESRRLSEELQAQQEELRTTNEELEGQAQQLKESEAKLQTQREELQVTNEELEEKNELLGRQKKEVEEARRGIERKAEEVALASKYKSEFLANMSHELRTPLNSLLLLAQGLTENKTGNLSPAQVESARIIHGSGSDLLNLINEILDLAKIEAGRMDLHLGTVRASDLADDVRASFAHMAGEKGLRLDVAVGPDAPAGITSDRKRIDQVLRNLMSNAVKFTESGGIAVTFGRSDRGGLSIVVRDTGIGIAPDKQKIIFEAFQQVDSGTARKYGGTGLGLSISRELAHLLGGEIRLESEPGKGSTFTLLLPAVATAADRRSPSSSTSTVTVPRAEAAPAAVQIEDDREKLGPEDKVILVIEDDPNFARLLQDKCHEKKFSCLAAPTGEKGLELAAKHLPRAILLDLRLPGMDGWAVLNTLKEDTRTRHIPVHILSVEEPSTEALRKGAVGHAVKPLDKKSLEATFRRLEQVAAGKPRRVLVVEDNAEFRRRTVQLIGDADVRVDEAGTGTEAMNALRSVRYDCVVLDLGLPDMDGGELLAKLEGEGVDLPPVIVHTARDLTHDDEAAIREHTGSIVIKDVRSQERLLDEVSLFLHRVVDRMPEKSRKIIRDLHETDELLRDKKVLIVDDDMRTAFAVSRLLAERGMKPLKAENGEKALRLLDTEPDVALVLMDIMMPVMDGYETMKRIRAQERFRKLPIITLTAKAMPEDREKCLAAGANDYMPKPVDVGRLLSMMRVWLYR